MLHSPLPFAYMQDKGFDRNYSRVNICMNSYRQSFPKTQDELDGYEIPKFSKPESRRQETLKRNTALLWRQSGNGTSNSKAKSGGATQKQKQTTAVNIDIMVKMKLETGDIECARDADHPR